ncbi:MAG TPA: class I SAM-dependent methyltransferase, partial [Acetobacteraceae bacterium]|nr:class I SAM-dependent methyltransferase [Acetobacteraceae bacterium]
MSAPEPGILANVLEWDSVMKTRGGEREVAGGARSLSALFLEHNGAVSDKWEQYLAAYESIFRSFIERQTPVRLLEIGVQNGGSLEIWSKYFPEGSAIIGIDIDPACAGLATDDNVTILTGDASDENTLDRQLGGAEYDIIIDDGSHRSDHVIATFDACFRRLTGGGIYIVEDLHCSYFSSHGGGFRHAGTSIEHFKELIDAVNSDHFEDDAAVQLGRAELQRLRSLGSQSARISFMDSLMIIEKLSDRKREPYRRVVTGREAQIADVVGTLALMPTELRSLQLSRTAADAFGPMLLEKLASAQEGSLRSTELAARLGEESKLRAEATDRLAGEVLLRKEAQQRESQATNRLADEVLLRKEAQQRESQATNRLADEVLLRREAQQRESQAYAVAQERLAA